MWNMPIFSFVFLAQPGPFPPSLRSLYPPYTPLFSVSSLLILASTVVGRPSYLLKFMSMARNWLWSLQRYFITFWSRAPIFHILNARVKCVRSKHLWPRRAATQSNTDSLANTTWKLSLGTNFSLRLPARKKNILLHIAWYTCAVCPCL